MSRLIDADALIKRWDKMSVRGRTEFDQEIMVAPTIEPKQADDLISRADAINELKEDMAALDRIVKGLGGGDARLDHFVAQHNQISFDIYAIEHLPSAQPKRGEWIPCEERLPKTDSSNEINEYDVLLAVRPKKHPEREPQIYIGKLRPVKGDDGSGNFWGVKTEPCEWTIWGWSYFVEPEVLAWMPLPQPYNGARMKGADDE